MKRFMMVGLLTVHSIWLIGLIPVQKLGLRGPFIGITYHLISSLSSMLLIVVICPKSLSNLKIKFARNKFVIVSLISAYLFLPMLIHSNIFVFSTLHILEGVLFAFSIGLDEELFSRGLILEVLKPLGTTRAIVLSSVHFGLLHITNFYAGQAFWVTVAQILGAAAFGFMCGAIITYTRSIWIPIFMHAMTDLPMVFETGKQYQQHATGSPDWIGTFALSSVYLCIGSVVLMLSSPTGVERLANMGSKLGLVTVGEK